LSSEKIYFSISEVCKKTGLEPHVLRYWETEFPQLNPKKNRAGNRVYRKKEIKNIEQIKFLLYTEHFTIQGAKKKMALSKDFPHNELLGYKSLENEQISKKNGEKGAVLSEIREDLADLLKMVKD